MIDSSVRRPSIVDFMEVGVRACNALRAAGVVTALDLASLTVRHLRAVSGCGRLTIAEIMDERSRLLGNPERWVQVRDEPVVGPLTLTLHNVEGLYRPDPPVAQGTTA